MDISIDSHQIPHSSTELLKHILANLKLNEFQIFLISYSELGKQKFNLSEPQRD